MTIATLLFGLGVASVTLAPVRADAQAVQRPDSATTDQRLDPAGLPVGPFLCRTTAREPKDSSAFQVEFVENDPPHFARVRRVDFDSLGNPLYAQLAVMTSAAEIARNSLSAVYLAVRFDGHPRGGRLDMKDGVFVTTEPDAAWSGATGLPGPARAMTDAEVAHAVAFAEWARTHRCDKGAPATSHSARP
jgi:hypothetical protein